MSVTKLLFFTIAFSTFVLNDAQMKILKIANAEDFNRFWNTDNAETIALEDVNSLTDEMKERVGDLEGSQLWYFSGAPPSNIHNCTLNFDGATYVNLLIKFFKLDASLIPLFDVSSTLRADSTKSKWDMLLYNTNKTNEIAFEVLRVGVFYPMFLLFDEITLMTDAPLVQNFLPDHK